jgi:glycosyltransferase involved in cell wall biosynthesis
MTGRPIRVALVMDHPAQQFTRGLQLLSADPALEVLVYYWWVTKTFHDTGFNRTVSWDVDLLGGYAWAAPKQGRPPAHRLLWYIRQLRRTRPDVIVCYGWATPIVRASLIWCALRRTPTLLYGDSTWQHSSRGGHRLVRSAALRLLSRICIGAVSTGAFNREFYIWHGMAPDHIWPGVCPADSELFAEARNSDPDLSGPGDPSLRIGFAGKLIARKGVDELIRASALLPKSLNWSVTVVGDGPMMPELQALSRTLGVDSRIEFHGFANTTEMPQLLAGFDVVVIPSRLDMRVLVTIEAMAAGAAVVVSDATAVWGPGDLIEDEVTGLVYHSGDPAALARQLCRLLNDPGLLAKLRVDGAERSADFGPDRFARTMASAVLTCLEVRERRGRSLRSGHGRSNRPNQR